MFRLKVLKRRDIDHRHWHRNQRSGRRSSKVSDNLLILAIITCFYLADIVAAKHSSFSKK